MARPLLHGIDLNLFRVFDAILREGNLTRAAARLFVSQSAVSHALARLRAQLGDPLFVRSGQGVAPTALARRISGDVRGAIVLMEGALKGARPFDPALDVGEIRIAMNDEIEPLVLPPLLERVRAVAPAARIASLRLDRDTLGAELAQGRLDCALDVARPAPQDVAHAAMLRDEFVVVARRRRALDREAYLAESHVTVSSRSAGRSVEDIEFARMGLERRVAVRCQQYETACRLVANGGLLLTMPRRLALSINRGTANHLLALPIRVAPLEVHAYWHRSREGDPQHDWLRNVLRDAMRAGADRPRRKIAPSRS
jgi:DNA-binding transcriptional LysR family regulator